MRIAQVLPLSGNVSNLARANIVGDHMPPLIYIHTGVVRCDVISRVTKCTGPLAAEGEMRK